MRFRSLVSALLRKATILVSRDPSTRYDLWRYVRCRFDLVEGTWLQKADDTRRPGFSFLVAHKDCIEFLELCIQSICRHAAGLDYEIIVVDDGSQSPDLARIAKLSPRLSLHRFDAGAGHPNALQWLYCRARAPYVVIMDQDAVLLDGHWDHFLAEFHRHPELLLIGVRDQCRLRNSPQMLHPSFILANKARCDAVLRPPFFFGAKPKAAIYRFEPEEAYYAFFCKALAHHPGSIRYLEQYQTNYGFGTVAYLDRPEQPVIYHQWYSGRVHALGDDDTIERFRVGDLRGATERFLKDQREGAVDLSPRTTAPDIRRQS